MTKIAFFDIDGTLINVPHQIMKPTLKTKEALIEFQKQGNFIVVASARGEMPEALKEIPFDGFIGCDGGYIVFHDEVLLDNIFTVQELNLQNSVYEATHGEYIISDHHDSYFSDKNGELIKSGEASEVISMNLLNDVYNIGGFLSNQKDNVYFVPMKKEKNCV